MFQDKRRNMFPAKTVVPSTKNVGLWKNKLIHQLKNTDYQQVTQIYTMAHNLLKYIYDGDLCGWGIRREEVEDRKRDI
jgi:hypothetical protein